MRTSFISGASIGYDTRRAIATLQKQLAREQEQLATGRHHDAGLVLGERLAGAVAMRQQHDQMKAIVEHNGLAETRLTASQMALGSIVDLAHSIQSTLLAARNADHGPSVAVTSAQSALAGLSDLLNTTVQGQHVFAGIDTAAAPFADYFANPASAAKLATDAAFLAEFGVSQGAPGAETIDAAAMRAFLDGAFAQNYDDPAWLNNWSSAANENIQSRVAQSVTIETSINANAEPFRQLASALTMVADLGAEAFSQPTFQVIADRAIEQVSVAIDGIGQLQTRLGSAQGRIADYGERLEKQAAFLEMRLDEIEGVDPFETSTRISSLITQLETSYALTARLNNLSLVNYV